ncbi:MAG: PAS domain S-box protein [Burkholderiales bacterium]|nr:PAS domain S-box protein [Burkholderiales bacterium]
MTAPPLRPARAPRGAAWAWPLLLALAFAGALAAWLQWSDARDAEQAQATLIADALTLESRVATWVGDEQARVDRLAADLPDAADDATLLGIGTVARGLQRDWISVTVLDASNRIVAHVPEQSPRPEARSAAAGVDLDEGGVSAHLSAAQRGGGKVIVRFAPALLLRQALPWWLARKYDVRLVDGLGQFIAGSGDPRPATDRYSHRVSVEPALVDTWLELTAREVPQPWWRTALPLLMAAFLGLTAAATGTLRRQMREVARAEREWRTEVAWRRAIEDALTVGLRGRDLEGRVMHVNRAFCDLVGYTPEQLLGKLPPMPYWPPDGQEVRMQRHMRNLAGGAPPNGYETHWVRADGTPLEVMIFEAPLVDALGEQVGWMGSVIDITERKRGEERERRQVEALATQARLTTLGEVASALAHQLNQPLTAITGYSAGVLRSLEGAGYGDRMVLAALRSLGEQAAEAGRIVQRIRGFLTRRAPQRERCGIAEIAERVMRLLRRDLERRGVELRLELAADLPAIDADPVLIEQVLINLVRNAADELAGASPAIVRIGAAVEGDALRVAVDDNGPGLQGRAIEELSAPFYSTKSEGMGMGLAICRSVVEAHRGALAAAPSPLGGARISFTLPLFPEE